MNTAGGTGTVLQQVEGNPHDGFAVLLREERHGADEARVRTPQLAPGLDGAALSGHGAILFPTRFFKAAQGAQRAGVVDGAQQDAPRARVAQVLAHQFERVAELPRALPASPPVAGAATPL